MRKTDLEEIRAVIHRVHAERFPDLDGAFLDAVLEAEVGSPEDDTGALRQIRQAVEAALSRTRHG